MSATFSIDEKTGKAFIPVLLSSESTSTFHAGYIMIDKAAAASEESLLRDRDALDELEWDNIVNSPRVLHGLRRLAAEARRQEILGEIEEGGFAVE